mmetsp:Transcript_39825/g.100106  ORF Transcript_39825/g.100106 Transcript_39825/m.100106 type:complete len:263 (+) Transcript_39825:1445-2233(+)
MSSSAGKLGSDSGRGPMWPRPEPWDATEPEPVVDIAELLRSGPDVLAPSVVGWRGASGPASSVMATEAPPPFPADGLVRWDLTRMASREVGSCEMTLLGELMEDGVCFWEGVASPPVAVDTLKNSVNKAERPRGLLPSGAVRAAGARRTRQSPNATSIKTAAMPAAAETAANTTGDPFVSASTGSTGPSCDVGLPAGGSPTGGGGVANPGPLAGNSSVSPWRGPANGKGVGGLGTRAVHLEGGNRTCSVSRQVCTHCPACGS